MGGKAMSARTTMLAHSLRGLLSHAGGSRVAKALLSWDSMATCARELAVKASGSGLDLEPKKPATRNSAIRIRNERALSYSL